MKLTQKILASPHNSSVIENKLVSISFRSPNVLNSYLYVCVHIFDILDGKRRITREGLLCRCDTAVGWGRVMG